jgi:hypothetical protein
MVNGGLTIMPTDFSQMTRQALKAYVLAHREDDDAIAALIQRSNPNCPKYPFPQTDEDFAAMEEIFRQKLHNQGNAA